MKETSDYDAGCAILHVLVVDVTKNQKNEFRVAWQEVRKSHLSDKIKDRTLQIKDKDNKLEDRLTELFLAALKKTEIDEERKYRVVYQGD